MIYGLIVLVLFAGAQIAIAWRKVTELTRLTNDIEEGTS